MGWKSHQRLAAPMLLSFERPARRRRLAGPSPERSRGEFRLSADLENHTVANDTGDMSLFPGSCPLLKFLPKFRAGVTLPYGRSRTASFALAKLAMEIAQAISTITRQDSKGTWWMPWHQESKKGVNGCDKPRLGAEWPLTRGCPNGETQRR